MGNASSSSKGTSLAAVAEMMLLTKPQVMDIRETCAAMASKDGQIRRKLFHIAVAKAGVQGHLEADILDLLFTMWDENCDNRVFYLDFVVGIAPLACRYENMNSALKFILQVMDHKESGKIDSSELMSILRGVNRTASFFGDSVLSENQMYKITDSVFDTITMISSDSEFISQSECVKTLLHEPLIEKLMAGSVKAGAKRMTSNLKINTNVSIVSNAKSDANNMPSIDVVSPSSLKRPLSNRSVTFADWKEPEQSYDQQVDAWRGGGGGGEQPFERTRLERDEDESAISTDQSSILLTPLNRVRVNRVRVAATARLERDEDESAMSTDQSSILLTPLNRVRVNRVRVAATTRLERDEDESAFSTDQSSILLTPLNRVRVNRVRVTATTTDSGSDLGSRQVPRVELRGF